MSKALGYGYNSAGQLTTLSTPSVQTITYGYAHNRIASVTVNSTILARYSTATSACHHVGRVWIDQRQRSDGRAFGYDEYGEHTYNYLRDYDPATGRYPQSDPIGLSGGLNTYAYADSNPVSKADPLGLVPGAGPGVMAPPWRPTPPIPGWMRWGGRIGGRLLGWIGVGILAYDVYELCRDNKETCQSHYTKCLESGWGGTVGFDSACFACFQRCQGSGEWPDSIIDGSWGEVEVSCKYWLKD